MKYMQTQVLKKKKKRDTVTVLKFCNLASVLVFYYRHIAKKLFIKITGQ